MRIPNSPSSPAAIPHEDPSSLVAGFGSETAALALVVEHDTSERQARRERHQASERRFDAAAHALADSARAERRRFAADMIGACSQLLELGAGIAASAGEATGTGDAGASPPGASGGDGAATAMAVLRGIDAAGQVARPVLAHGAQRYQRRAEADHLAGERAEADAERAASAASDARDARAELLRLAESMRATRHETELRSGGR